MEVNAELMHSLNGARFMESACSADTISLYSLNECYWAGRSPFCDIVIAESPVYGKVLFLDKELQSAESDEAIYHEHLVHPALNALAERKEKRILIVGGGEGATAREVLKWSENSVATVDWVDIDHHLVDLCRRHLSWADDCVYNDRRLRFFGRDIREFWASNNNKYDLIILDLPDPDIDSLVPLVVSETSNDYPLYSREFMRVMAEHLTPGGAFVSHCGPISPGGDPHVRRAGLMMMRSMCQTIGLGNGSMYHTTIPSFQSSWGFFLSCEPSDVDKYPSGLAVMDSDAQQMAFHWPRFWNSPFFGHSGAAS
jgi:spermidine synthase